MTKREYVFTLASFVWGEHPMSWPTPPRKIPRWWQFRQRKNLAALEYVLGRLDADAVGRYWAEVRKGQSVYEDAGGYMLRCYEAMLGYPTESPYTYGQATEDLLREHRAQG